MSENDLNNDQAVTDQDLNTAGSVDQQDLTDQVVDDQKQDDVLADGTTKDKSVPYAELEKATQRTKAAEEQAAYAQRQLELMQQNAQLQQQTQQQTAPKTVSELALDSLGITSEDLYGDNVVKFQEAVTQINNANNQLANAQTEVQQFAAKHPDINEVVGSVNLTTGQIVAPTQEVYALVQKKPYLAQASTSDIYNAVIEERQFAEFKKNAVVNDEHLNRQNANNKSQPLGGSAAGGGGTGSQSKQQLMSREQVRQTEADIAAGKYS